jgi:hypothetical protein
LNWSSSTFLLPYKLENDSVEQNVPGFKIKWKLWARETA